MANKKQAKLNYKKGYGKNYKQLRENANMTQKELGEEINYSGKVITLIETENRTPTIEQLNAYRKYFKVSYDYLLGETTVTSTDCKHICEYTGLSGASVNILHDLKDIADEKMLIEVIDYLLSDYTKLGVAGKYESLLGLIREYLFAEYVLPGGGGKQEITYRVKGQSDLTRFELSRIKEIVLSEITQKLYAARAEIEGQKDKG